MNIVEEVKMVLDRDSEKNGGNLEEALRLYHELVKKKLITPRGNRLIDDNVVYKKGSNFM